MIMDFEYFRAKSLQEVLLMKGKSRSEILAGGTDLLVRMKTGETNPKILIDIKKVPDLNRIILNPDGSISIGASVTFSDILESDLLKQECPILYKGAQVMGTTQIRNRATIGGNICHGSPAADSVPPLMCLGAQLLLINRNGERWLPIENFHEGPRKTCLKPEEFLCEIKIPPIQPRSFCAYLKHGVRKSLEIAIVSIGLLVFFSDEEGVIDNIRISLGSVSHIPVRSKEAEDILKGKKITKDLIEKTALTVQKSINPISDLRGSAEYRYEMAYMLTKRVLQECCNHV